MLRDRLRELREVAGLSARELSKLVGVSQPYTSMIESGVRGDIGTKVAEKYAEVFGCSLDWLVLGKGAKPAPEDVIKAVRKAQKKQAA